MARLNEVIEGAKFNNWTVLNEAPRRSKNSQGRFTVRCRCECGHEADVVTASLGINKTCMKCRIKGERNANWKNGAASHYLYAVWTMMIQRCHNPDNKSYYNYGARGIVVCQRWRGGFWNFVNDMGSRPPGRSIERIDNDGPYAPWNCRWGTAREQRLNSRRVNPGLPRDPLTGRYYSPKAQAPV